MKISLHNISQSKIPRIENLKDLARKVLQGEDKKRNYNIIFCDNHYIRELNLKFRKLNRATDVLAFTYREQEIWGEVYISVEKAKKQAPRWGNSLYKELKRLIVHGLLHILGYDHKAKKDKIAMIIEENIYLKA